MHGQAPVSRGRLRSSCCAAVLLLYDLTSAAALGSCQWCSSSSSSSSPTNTYSFSKRSILLTTLPLCLNLLETCCWSPQRRPRWQQLLQRAVPRLVLLLYVAPCGTLTLRSGSYKAAGRRASPPPDLLSTLLRWWTSDSVPACVASSWWRTVACVAAVLAVALCAMQACGQAPSAPESPGVHRRPGSCSWLSWHKRSPPQSLEALLQALAPQPRVCLSVPLSTPPSSPRRALLRRHSTGRASPQGWEGRSAVLLQAASASSSPSHSAARALREAALIKRQDLDAGEGEEEDDDDPSPFETHLPPLLSPVGSGSSGGGRHLPALPSLTLAGVSPKVARRGGGGGSGGPASGGGFAVSWSASASEGALSPPRSTDGKPLESDAGPAPRVMCKSAGQLQLGSVSFDVAEPGSTQQLQRSPSISGRSGVRRHRLSATTLPYVTATRPEMGDFAAPGLAADAAPGVPALSPNTLQEAMRLVARFRPGVEDSLMMLDEC